MSICLIEPRLDREAIFSALGLAPEHPHYAVFLDCYGQFETPARANMERRAVWCEVPASVLPKRPAGGQAADRLLVGTATCGAKASEHLGALMADGDFLESYVLNEMYNNLLFNATEDLQSAMRTAWDCAGGGLSRPYFPGDGDIDLRDQDRLMAVLAAELAGRVILNDHHMLLPEKSMLFVMFGGPEIQGGRAGHDCAHCARQRTCSYSSLNRQLPAAADRNGAF